MSKRKKTYFNWSTGKDSAMALFTTLQNNNQLEITALVTAINAHHNRVSMHGLRRELLQQQAKVLNLPLHTIELPQNPSMEVYTNKMEAMVQKLKKEGYTDCIFGDIFLEDLRQYRENQLEKLAIKSHFPLWKKDTKKLILEFIDRGFKAIVLTINANQLDQSFLGRTIDKEFIQDLPKGIDPCGENGEFHTFCYDGPLFDKAIGFEIGEKIYKTYPSPQKEKEELGFWFLDLIPTDYYKN